MCGYLSLMQSVKGAQFLNITTLSALFPARSAAAVFGTVIVPLKSMHNYITQAWLQYLNFKVNLTIYVISSTWVILNCYPIFVLNLDGWVVWLSNRFIIFWYFIFMLLYYIILFLCYYNLNASIIICVFSGNIFFTSDISLWSSVFT